MELFLAAFQNNLIQQGSPETAFILSVEDDRYGLPEIFRQSARDIQLQGIPLDAVLDRLIRYFRGQEVARILASLRRILSHSLRESIYQIQRFLVQIQRQRILVNKRENIRKAMRFKARILIGLTSFLVGFITALAPFFRVIELIREDSVSHAFISTILASPPLIAFILPLTLLLFVHFRADHRIGETRTRLYILFSIGLYVVGYSIAFSLFIYSVPLL
ncbi:MAG: hypothetical protein ACTSW4_03690 [Candidatus Ranarchaeia archaeon]